MNNMFKNLVIWLVIGLVLMTVFNQFNTRQPAQAPMEYSQFLDEVKAGRITKVTIEGRTAQGHDAPTASASPATPRATSGWYRTCSSTASRSRPSPRKSSRS